jgi:hypothetical protein
MLHGGKAGLRTLRPEESVFKRSPSKHHTASVLLYSITGRHIYSQRLGTVEPVFANICSTLGLKRFSLRSQAKVDAQWKLFCIVHNLLKIHRYGPGFA